MTFYKKSLLRNVFPKKVVLGMILAVGSVVSVFADNKIYFDSNTLSIKPGKQADVVVKLEVDQVSAATQVRFKLPIGLTLVEKKRPTIVPGLVIDSTIVLNRYAVANSYSPSLMPQSDGSYIIGITNSFNDKPIVTDDGELLRFTVQATDALAAQSEIQFLSASTSLTNGSVSIPLATTNITVNKDTSVDPLHVTMTVAPLTIDASETRTVTVEVDNGDAEVYLGQVSVRLPQGLTMVGADDDWATPTDRVYDLVQGLTCSKNGDHYTVALVHKNPAVPFHLRNDVGHNRFFTFQVQADTTLAASSNIEFIDIAFSDKVGTSVPVSDFNVVVTSPNAAARPVAAAAVSDAWAQLAAIDIPASLAANPLIVADKAAAQSAIDALDPAIRQDYLAGNLDDTPAPYAAELQTALDAINQLRKTVAEAVAKQNADAQLQALRDALAAIVIPAEVAADPKVIEARQAAQNAINAYENAAVAAFADGRHGNLSEKTADMAALAQQATDAINALASLLGSAQQAKELLARANALDDIINAAEHHIVTNDPTVAADYADDLADLRSQADALQQEITTHYNAEDLTPQQLADYATRIDNITNAANALKDDADAQAEALAKNQVEQALAEAKQAVDDAAALVAGDGVNDNTTVDNALLLAQHLYDNLVAAAQQPYKDKVQTLRSQANDVIAAAQTVTSLVAAAQQTEATAKQNALTTVNTALQSLQQAFNSLDATAADMARPDTLRSDVASQKAAAQQAVNDLADLVNNQIGDGNFWKQDSKQAVTDAQQAVSDAIAALGNAIAQHVAQANAQALTDANAALQQLQDSEAAAIAAVEPEIREHPFFQLIKQTADNAIQEVSDFITANSDKLATKQPNADLADKIATAQAAITAITDISGDLTELQQQNNQALAELLQRLDSVGTYIDDLALILNGTPQVKPEFQPLFNELSSQVDSLDAELRMLCNELRLLPHKDDETAKIDALAQQARQTLAQASAAEKAYLDNETAMGRLTSQLNTLQVLLDNAVLTINGLADVAPDYAQPLDGFQHAIDSLRADVANRHALRQLNNESTVPVDSLRQAIIQLVQQAQQAQQQVDQLRLDNYDALAARLDTLKLLLDSVNNNIATQKDETVQQAVDADQRAIATQLANLVQDLLNAKQQLADPTVVQHFNDNIDVLRDAINALMSKANNLQEEADAEAATLLAAQSLRSAADELVAPVVPADKQDNPFYADAVAAVAQAQAAIDAAQQTAYTLDSLAHDKVASHSVLAAADTIQDVANDAVAALTAAQQAIADAETALADAAAAETKAQADNAAAAEQLLNELKDLKTKLDATWGDIRRNDRDVENQLQTERDDIDRDITDNRELLKCLALAQSLADADRVDSLRQVYQAISDAIDALKEKADRMQENETAKNRLDAQLDDMQRKLDAAQNMFNTDFKDVKDEFTDRLNALYGKKDSLQGYVDSLYADTLLTRDTSIDTDVEDLSLAIDRLLADAQARHTSVGIAAHRVDASESGAQYFTLSGRRVSGPVRGQTMIIKYADGTLRKVMIK